ncbi:MULTISPECIES: amino acid permease [Brevibacillus]|jgi:amino acid transporter|uniref:Amino acid permease n=1 Tax=Brevibacillus parabrevis TaxID=54914 RepID=A0A4Y3PA87_BREPA|nr:MULTISPECIES: amino acid permease [Brevibacillus]MBU8711823.1 amino acid permease [Brevibacillus parabrevis]MDH6348893.1 amino acid transporter [Brevibacillus sp. 1238]MED2257838.1 amino acid permease [Brevibacillus parabrevis]NRQ51841.1 amino acid permease [Brevibacillus sp. HD1.4A]RNB93483.1 amino acid permease [Brevibacillus parabrevis]
MQQDKEHQLLEDKKDLNKFGYAQELLRDMGGFSNFAISFSIISILTGAVSLYGHGLLYGGPGMMGFGWTIVALFVILIAASMSELASAIPTAGALYHWAAILGSKRWGWYTAWINLIGQIGIVAGIDYSFSLFADPLLASAFGYTSTETTTLILFGITLLLHGIFNHIGIRLVARLNDFSAWYHIGVVVVLVGSLVFFSRNELQPLDYLFQVGQTFSDKPYAIAFLIGLLQAQWTFTGYDASAHTIEETINPRVRAAWGIFTSVAFSFIFGFIMLAFVTLSIHDAAAASAADNAFIYVISAALGGTFGSVVLWLVTFAMWFCGLASITSFSRMLYAFSRDKGMPWSRQWAEISRKYRTPAKAIWLVVILSFALALFDYILKRINPDAEYTTLAFLTAVSVVGLYVAYGIPLYLKLRAESRGVFQRKHFGPWNLGNWSKPINVLSLLWIVFISIMMVIPPNQTAAYALIAMFVVLIIMDLAYYRKHFAGPQAALSTSAEEIKRQEAKFRE